MIVLKKYFNTLIVLGPRTRGTAEIVQNIQGGFFTVMADETADISNKEQVVACIRWVDSNFHST